MSQQWTRAAEAMLNSKQRTFCGGVGVLICVAEKVAGRRHGSQHCGACETTRICLVLKAADCQEWERRKDQQQQLPRRIPFHGSLKNKVRTMRAKVGGKKTVTCEISEKGMEVE